MPGPLRALVLASLTLALPRTALAVCGDGLLDTAEECDDLNTADGDGCDASCAVEDGWECADASFAMDFAETITTVDPTHSLPSWSLSSDGTTLTQSLNAFPAVYVSTLPAVGVSMTFELSVNTTSDDDFIGWAIGYDAGENVSTSADWLLFDWKQGDQNWDGADGWAGLRMYRVTGPIEDSYELWGHYDDVTEVAEATNLGSTGWADNTTYTIQVDYSTTQVDVWVDGAHEFSESGSFPTGTFGFYNFSQPAIEYQLIAPLDQSVCALADSDGDGITDLDEDVIGTDRLDPDTDGDGLGDLFEVGDLAAPTDSDADGTIDAADPDDDGDGVPTASEDPDGDGDPTDDDTDTDGTPDYLDPDDDGDTVPTASEDWDGDGDPTTGDADGDGILDYLEPDSDADGFGDAGDCDPGDASVNPAATEVCDGIDNDCDGTVDEADATDAGTWYADLDGDGYGDPASSTVACTAPSGWVSDNSDCRDDDPLVFPGSAELCNGMDDDCDGVSDEDDAIDAADWYADADADGYGDATESQRACTQPSGTVADASDCDDTDAAVSPAATELCNGIDDDCDGVVDEDDASDAATWYSDADRDGYGNPASSTRSCDQPPDTAAGAGDCDDGDAAVNPGAAEVWYDGVDQDCDGAADYDQDGDGYDSAAETEEGEDCDDTDPEINPEASEIWYDGVDQDCDGASDYDRDGDGYDSESYGGDDCDDADADTWPGAPDEPYDGVIHDCDHTSDYDADQDGHDASAYGGDDCDDAASDVNPDQEEIWYDGVDQDCDGNDDDQDEDGWPVDEDCDDTDASAYPGAEGWTEDCEPVVEDTGTPMGDTGTGEYKGGACGGCSSSRAPLAPALLLLLGLVGLRRRR